MATSLPFLFFLQAFGEGIDLLFFVKTSAVWFKVLTTQKQAAAVFPCHVIANVSIDNDGILCSYRGNFFFLAVMAFWFERLLNI